MSDKLLSKAMLRMLKAREVVARRNIFFASIIYGARIVEGMPSGVAMPTMCTDGINVWFDPKFVEENDPYIEGILLHEVLHCALNHIPRCQHRKRFIWGQAIDYAVNPLVSTMFKLPVSEKWRGLQDDRFNDMSAEQIYEILLKEQGGEDSGDGDGEEAANDSSKPKSGDNQRPVHAEEQEKNEKEWRRIVAIAAERAKGKGNMPQVLERLLAEIMPSDKIDWRGLLENMAHEAKTNITTSWVRPNRRYIGGGTIMPGEAIEKVYRLVVCFDTSGSISEGMLGEMKGEVMTLLEQQIITHATLIATDTVVHNMADVDLPEGVREFKPKGGGGTHFEAAMQAVAQVEDAVGCIFLTDMQTESFGENPGIPVIWVDWTKSCPNAPFGRVVPYD